MKIEVRSLLKALVAFFFGFVSLFITRYYMSGGWENVWWLFASGWFISWIIAIRYVIHTIVWAVRRWAFRKIFCFSAPKNRKDWKQIRFAQRGVDDVLEGYATFLAHAMIKENKVFARGVDRGSGRELIATLEDELKTARAEVTVAKKPFRRAEKLASKFWFETSASWRGHITKETDSLVTASFDAISK